MKYKKCFKCQQELSLENFYKHSQMGDGRLNKCKDCTKSDVKEHRSQNIERVREYDRNRPNAAERNEKFKRYHKERMKDDEYRLDLNAKKKVWNDNNVVRRAAHIITGNSIRDGRLIRKPCEVCGEIKVDAHHDDYERPLDVRWLCRTHHSEHHKNLRNAARNQEK